MDANKWGVLQAAETEKQARLRHAATQRKRAMETLVAQAKRKRK